MAFKGSKRAFFPGPRGCPEGDDMRELSTSDETFREIIEQDRLYADKTGHVAQMIKSHKSRFLSSPRRFGKTLRSTP
jgi:hypothetical protein